MLVGVSEGGVVEIEYVVFFEGVVCYLMVYLNLLFLLVLILICLIVVFLVIWIRMILVIFGKSVLLRM